METQFMAKQSQNGGINKSQAIRDELSLNPLAKSKEVVAKLATKGIHVSENLVYLVKAKASQKKRRVKREKAAEISRSLPVPVDPIKLIVSLKELARETGGIRQLKRLVDVLAE
jgi:hypothetical protein